jgi:hypothetical protein
MKPDKNYIGKVNVTFGTTLDGTFTYYFDNHSKDIYVMFYIDDGLYELNDNDDNDDNDIKCHYFYNKEHDLFISDTYEEWQQAIKINYLISQSS